MNQKYLIPFLLQELMLKYLTLYSAFALFIASMMENVAEMVGISRKVVGFLGGLSVGELSAMGAAFIFSEATVPVCIIGVGIFYFVGSMEGQAFGEYFVDYIHNKYYVEK